MIRVGSRRSKISNAARARRLVMRLKPRSATASSPMNNENSSGENVVNSPDEATRDRVPRRLGTSRGKADNSRAKVRGIKVNSRDESRIMHRALRRA